VKVVIAEGLVPLDSSPSSKLETFVTHELRGWDAVGEDQDDL